jgi:hypothetical protein
MKKLVVTMVAVVACVSAFAQGKVIFGNDSNHLVTLGNASQLSAAPQWLSLAGLACPQIGGPGAYTMGNLTAELWAGTSAANLALAMSLPADGLAGLPDGRFNNHNTILASGLSGTVTFQIRVWETVAGSWTAASTQPGFVSGESPVFTAVSGSLLYNPLTLPGAPSNSTWANGPILLTSVPEPSTFALAGLGIAGLLIFRRRK